MAAGSGVQTLTVSHSPVPSAGRAGCPPASASITACGAAGPNSFASRTSSHGAGGSGAWNRSGPIGGLANGIPRKTAMPFSIRPLTRPALVETTGSAGAM